MLGGLFLICLARMLRGWGEVVVVLGLMAGSLFLGFSDFGWAKLRLLFELDGLGLSLFLLSIWVVCMALLARGPIKGRGPMKELFLLANVSLLLFLGLRFRVSDFIYFYLRFECRLVPVFFMILG